MTQERLTGVIIGMGTVAIILSTWLVYSQLFVRPTCPELLGIPACYLVLVCYLVATISAAFPGSASAGILFYAGIGSALAIATYGSSGQATGNVTCPSFEGLPMCFTSFLAAFTMIGADVWRRAGAMGRGVRPSPTRDAT
jgi:hypothetical protein